MILIWRRDTNPEFWTEANPKNYLDLCDQGLNITGCVPVPRSLPNLAINIRTSGKPSDFFFAGLVSIVSGKMRDLLEGFKIHAEFLSVEVTQKGRIYTQQNYYFLNILDVVDCFDYEKSRYKKTKKGVFEIERLVLDDSKAKGHHLYRVGPLLSSTPNPKAVGDVIVCASEELASCILGSGLTGVVFTTPKDRSTFPPPGWKPAS